LWVAAAGFAAGWMGQCAGLVLAGAAGLAENGLGLPRPEALVAHDVVAFFGRAASLC